MTHNAPSPQARQLLLKSLKQPEQRYRIPNTCLPDMNCRAEHSDSTLLTFGAALSEATPQHAP